MEVKSIGQFKEEEKKIPLQIEITTHEIPNTVTEVEFNVYPNSILIDNRDSGKLFISFDGINFKEIAPFTTIWFYNSFFGMKKIYLKSDKSLNKAEITILY
jgi:hypothetical protein